MSTYKILEVDRGCLENPDALLCTPASEVLDYGDSLQCIVDNLIETLYSSEIAVGLSATQVGISLRIAVINIERNNPDDTLVMINPVVLATGGKKDKKKEQCLSVPNLRGEVERRHKISIEYTNRYGANQTLQSEGFAARVIAHEIDHLNGILYIQRMDSLDDLEDIPQIAAHRG